MNIVNSEIPARPGIKGFRPKTGMWFTEKGAVPKSPKEIKQIDQSIGGVLQQIVSQVFTD